MAAIHDNRLHWAYFDAAQVRCSAGPGFPVAEISFDEQQGTAICHRKRGGAGARPKPSRGFDGEGVVAVDG